MPEVVDTTSSSCSPTIVRTGVIKTGVTINDAEFNSGLAFLRTYGLTKFDSVDAYDPHSFVTRAQAAKMFVNLAINVFCKTPNTSLVSPFTDIANMSDLTDYMVKAYQLGLMNGSN